MGPVLAIPASALHALGYAKAARRAAAGLRKEFPGLAMMEMERADALEQEAGADIRQANWRGSVWQKRRKVARGVQLELFKMFKTEER
ncbi:hypothetical protein [Polyangium fumosum]|uniref:Uncharacterized protein n=1 Tax=Polyangium fumosum TaxID=889272 RepID=A0A4V5PNG7_9BACT|nr:hypothetical protein [Polyangium fumosum]TKD00406.1 hypothetical protein E8A74_34495 [Polyangium fumosum]